MSAVELGQLDLGVLSSSMAFESLDGGQGLPASPTSHVISINKNNNFKKNPDCNTILKVYNYFFKVTVISSAKDFHKLNIKQINTYNKYITS
jgi:hypothetical protein